MAVFMMSVCFLCERTNFLPKLKLFSYQVKVLFVRNLASSVTEEILEKAFSQFGKLERVKKLKDYAFIHFEERDGAVKVWTTMKTGF